MMDAETINSLDAMRQNAIELGRNMIQLEVNGWMLKHSHEVSLEALQELSEAVGLKKS